MMANNMDTEKSGKLVVTFSSFLGTYKKLLTIIGIVVVLALVALWIGLGVANSNADKKQLVIDGLQADYTAWTALEDKTTAEATAAAEKLVAGLQGLASKGGSKYPELKASYLLAMIDYTNEKFSAALEGFLKVADNGKDTYLGPLSLNNAAVVSEQLGDNAKALAPKALFNVARLQEASNNIALAKAVLQQLADEFPSSEYAKLAQSRLVVLQ
jgi:outer membrane protein assembly factor BamD (BamD/ComL family)